MPWPKLQPDCTRKTFAYLALSYSYMTPLSTILRPAHAHSSLFQWLLCALLIAAAPAQAQFITDDFEGNGNISSWAGDDCALNTAFANPHQQGINTSATVLRYHDMGGQYANVRFDIPGNFDLTAQQTFSLKIYVPSSGLTGTAPNQVSLKLQNGVLSNPWTTQCEIIKPLQLDQWQTVTFNFATDPYLNYNQNSPPPIQRGDFNRVIIQVNGENNNFQVVAFIDDLLFNGTPPTPSPYSQLVWSDEFNGSGAIDTSKWFHQTQLPAGGSWFNGEIQHYTNRTDNSFVANGNLHIVAKRENFTAQGQTKTHTSARLNSKFAFTYGRVEARAKLPTGIGTWPAIWTLGKNINENGAYWDLQGFGTTSWPACGEIDIMEHWGDNQNFVQSAMHTPSSFGNTVNKGGQTIPTVSTAFHVYELEWSPEKIVFSVDGRVHYTYNPAVKNASTWPFTADQYLILNIAIQPIIQPSFTQSSMEIDYVRVYQLPNTTSMPELTGSTQLAVYPNPATDQLTIELPELASQKLHLRLFNAQGQLLRDAEHAPSDKVLRLNELGGLPGGLYLLQLEAGGRLYFARFVKE
jgi:beta-glucanase (GH16 family)